MRTTKQTKKEQINEMINKAMFASADGIGFARNTATACELRNNKKFLKLAGVKNPYDPKISSF